DPEEPRGGPPPPAPQTLSQAQGEVSAATLARHDHAARVDLELARVGHDPLEPGGAVVEPGRVGRDLGHRGRRDAVAVVDHDNGDPAGGDETRPGTVVAVGAG